MIKIFIIDKVFTKGIIEKEADIKEWGDSVRKEERAYAPGIYPSYKVGVEAFYTREEAIEKANQVRCEKIESLKRQIKKLEKICIK